MKRFRGMRFAAILLVAGALIAGSARSAPAGAAVGCTLSNPAQDLKYLYPELTSYKEVPKVFTSLADGDKHYAALKERLGSDLDPIYESYDTPYTVYEVFQNDTVIGYVHGVNVPGKGGVIQVFLATDPKTSEIQEFFFQRIESPSAKELKGKDFRAQFAGLTLADFYMHDYYAKADAENARDKVAQIKAPTLSEDGKPDYAATLRGIRKNLILLDLFIYERRAEAFYERAKEALKKFEEAKGKK